MKIAVGSTNPVKIRAVRNVTQKIFPRIKIIALDVSSDVPAQPIGDEETRRGAINRARAARAATDADWGVGLEGGIIENEWGTMACAWCAIVNREGPVGIGGMAGPLLPKSVAARVKMNAELGEAMDKFAKIRNVKRKMGAVGVLTKGLTNRQRAYEQIIKFAVARFLWKEKF